MTDHRTLMVVSAVVLTLALAGFAAAQDAEIGADSRPDRVITWVTGQRSAVPLD